MQDQTNPPAPPPDPAEAGHSPRRTRHEATAATVCNALAAGGVASSLVWSHGMMVACVGMMVFGAWCLLAGRWCWQTRDNPAALINLVLAAYALASAAISFSHGDPAGHFEQYLPFLGAGLLAVGLRVANPHPALLGSAFATATLLAAVPSIFQVLQAEGPHRANLLAFSTWFGTRGALYAILCAGFLGWAAATNPSWRRTLLVAGLLGGATVALLSGSKGAWLPLMAAGPFALFRAFGRTGLKPAALVFTVVALGLTAAVLLPHSPVIPRIQEALREGDRLRLAYWHESWQLAETHPLLGAGRNALRANLNRASLIVRNGTPLEEPPDNAHNEYLDVLAARGTAGLLVLLACYAVPLGVLWHLRRSSPGADGPAFVGIIFLGALAISGLTDVQFAVNAQRMTFLFVTLFAVNAATRNIPGRGPS